jgi:ribosomal peptide maturation radical SAM protein 1
MGSTDVVIVVPPFATAAYPSLGPSLLVAACRKRGIDAKIYYANLRLATSIGLELYQRISSSSPEYLAGEALFSATAFESLKEEPGAVGVLERVFEGLAGVPSYNAPDLTKDDMLCIIPAIERYVDACATEVLRMRPRVVGFSSVFQQHLASIALARKLKHERPDVCTVVGGGNTAGAMGPATAELTDAFDYVFSGEADFEFPQFCEKLLFLGERPAERMIVCESVQDMDAVEVPTFEDYYEQLPAELYKGTSSPDLPEVLPFEASRGCWYGAKNHCTFCGLNGMEIGYRRKSSPRILDEIFALSRTYHLDSLYAVDNIMPRQFLSEVLPALAENPAPLELFFEVKANLREDELDLFVLGGVAHIQAGIESLSSHVLKLMAKGVNARQCIKLLVDCASRQIDVRWNFIYGFPGESRDDYVQALAVIPYLEHLQPPIGFGAVRVDRFSPYQVAPERYGIERLDPTPAYSKIYPHEARIADLAYCFVGAYDTEFTRDEPLVSQLGAALLQWGRCWERAAVTPRLWQLPGSGDQVVIEDTRSAAIKRYHSLAPDAAAALDRLRQPTRRDRIEPACAAALEPLIGAHIVIEHEDHLLSLVTDPAKGVELRKRRSERSK